MPNLNEVTSAIAEQANVVENVGLLTYVIIALTTVLFILVGLIAWNQWSNRKDSRNNLNLFVEVVKDNTSAMLSVKAQGDSNEGAIAELSSHVHELKTTVHDFIKSPRQL